jgi:hypothetical protein
MTINDIQDAIDAAFAAATANPVAVAASQLAANVSIQTDLYTGPQGPGFQVVARIGARTGTMPNYGMIISIVRQSGPETWRSVELPVSVSLTRQIMASLASDLMNVFTSQPLGIQAFYNPVRNAVAAALTQGNVADALEIVTTAPATSLGSGVVPLLTQILNLYSAILALFPS